MRASSICLCLLVTLSLLRCKSYSQDNATQLEPQAFKDSIAKNDVQIIDVRTRIEFRENHIEKAINVNFFSKKFEDSIRLLDREVPVFVYCRSGRRSGKSITVFKNLGFEKIYELEGGILNWKDANFKLISR